MKFFLGLLSVFLAAVLAGGAEPAFDPQEIRVGMGECSAIVFVTTDANSTNSNEKPVLTAIHDLGALGGLDAAPNLQAAFSAPVEVSRAGSRATWKSTLTLRGVPRAASLTRLAQLVFSDKSNQTTRYTLSSRAKNFSWSVTTGAKRIVVPPNQTFEITVVPTGDDATNLRIDGNSLQETSSGHHLDPSWLRLDPASSDRLAILPQGIRTTVTVALADAIPNGTYSGSLNFAVDESPESKGVEMTLYRSGSISRWLGVGAILLGVVLAFVGGTLAKNFSAAADALMPAARLTGLTASRRAKLENCVTDAAQLVPKTLAALQDIDDALSPEQLRAMRFVPGWLASPFGVAQIATAAYGTYLQEKSNRLAELGFLIDQGICPAAQEEFDSQNTSHLAARKAALAQLDLLSVDPAKTIQTLAAEIPPILAAYGTALHPPPPGAVALGAPPALADIAQRPTLETLSFRLNLASAGAWSFALVAAVITGYYVLIASNFGFGSEMDFLKCFLWGLGVQLAGQQVSLLTPASVTSALGFKAPTT